MRINAFIQVLIFFSALVLMLSGINFQLTAGENQKRIEYPPAKPYNVTKAASKVKLDGILDEEAWKKAVKIDLPFEWTPGDNIPTPVETICMVTFSKSKLYIAFQCFDPEPKKTRDHLMNRDAIDTFLEGFDLFL